MDQVNENLYIGTLKEAGDARRIREEGIDVVHKLSHKQPPQPYPETVDVVLTPLIDRNISRREYFDRAVEELAFTLREGDTAFVHCSAGVSRTPAITGTAIAIVENIDLDAALEMLRVAMKEGEVHSSAVGSVAVEDDDPIEIHPKIRSFGEDLIENDGAAAIPDERQVTCW